MTLTYLTWITITATATATVCLVLYLVAQLPKRAHALAGHDRGAPPRSSDETVFLFKGSALIDTDRCSAPTPSAETFDWAAFRRWLLPRFAAIPDIPSMIDAPAEIAARDDPAARLIFEPGPEDSNTLRVRLRDAGLSDPSQRHELRLQMLTGLTHIAQTRDCPYPLWRLDLTGRILWRNAACDSRFEALSDLPLPGPGERRNDQVSLRNPLNMGEDCFEIHTIAQPDGFARYAIETTRVRTAEAARVDFIQTLTKTFAHLTVGLAVFDQRRQLVLFNPALTDLTRLPPEFMATKPSLNAFFDRLRDGHVMPEPRDYTDWRRQIDDMLSSAEDGLYQETWSLPSNVTYKVTGRPHPDGAVAFFFEDISADVQQSRRHQSEMSTRDAMIEALDQAVMIVCPDDRISLCNSAFRQLVGIAPDRALTDLRLTEALKSGQAEMPHPRFWKELNKLIRTTKTRGSLGQGPILDDRPLAARVRRLPDGGRMVLIGPEDGTALALSA